VFALEALLVETVSSCEVCPFCILDKKFALAGTGCVARSAESQALPLKPAASCSFQGRTVTPINELKEIDMKNLKRLGLAFALTLVLALSASAGITETPPCAPPDPGITETPPCAAAQMSPDDSAAPGTALSTPASNTVDIVSVVDAALNLLTLF
jgi:hypothetical protein